MTERERFEEALENYFNGSPWLDSDARAAAREFGEYCWQAARRWIPVEEELPEDRKDVLITDDYDVMIGYYIKEKGTWSTSAEGYDAENFDGGCEIRLDTGDIKRWQPLTEPPENYDE